jgi:hypothetical protein
MSAAPQQICINSCPTGGWLMNNRKRIEKEMRAKYPNATITHAVGLPFTISVTSDGKQSKRSCGFPLFFCPSCIGCGDAKKFTSDEFINAGGATTGAPKTETMAR